MSRRRCFHLVELDRTTFPAFRDRILAYESRGGAHEPRSYPGYPRVELDDVRPRLLPRLDATLAKRRCASVLKTEMLSRKEVSQVLRFSHGSSDVEGRGPAPSAGGLQALELYVAAWEPSWLKSGAYHYDRAGHHLSCIDAQGSRASWEECVPSLRTVTGGAMLFVVTGDAARVTEKYGERGVYFLALEAGHLMQNLCLMSASLGYCMVPLGGFYEAEVAKALHLPAEDVVLYAGVCGKPER